MKETKGIRKYTSILVMLVMLLFFQTKFILAAEGSVTYGSTSYTTTQGENFQVGVYVKGSEAIGAYEFYLDYNPDMMEYVSGADSGGAGRLKFVGYGNSSSYSYMLTFRAVTAGNCTISISGADLGPLNPSSGDSMTITQASSAPVTIQGPQTASDDCSLSSLTLSPIGPFGFSPSTTEYDMTVDYDLTKVSVSATTSSDKATYTISDTNLNVGANTIKIVVTAENGATKTYNIIVRRKPEETTSAPTTTAQPTTPAQTNSSGNSNHSDNSNQSSTQATTTASSAGLTPEELEQAISFYVNGKEMFVSEVPSEDTIPEGFSKTTVSYKEKEIEAYAGGSQNVTLFYMVDGLKSNGGFYVYDAADNSVYPYITLENAQGSYLLLLAEGVSAPAGYTATTITLAGNDSESVQTNVSAWVSNSNAEFFLVYALNPNGDTGFYQYDTKEKTIQRYHAQAGGESGSADLEGLKEALAASRLENQKSSKTHFMMIILLAVLCILLLIVIIALVFKIRGMIGGKRLEELEDEPEEKFEEPEEILEVSVPNIKKAPKPARAERQPQPEKPQKSEKTETTKKPAKRRPADPEPEPDPDFESEFEPDFDEDEEVEFDLDEDFEFFDYEEEENEDR